MSGTAAKMRFIPRDGYYEVEIDGTPRGWVEHTEQGWQARVLVSEARSRQLGKHSVKVGVPYPTRREAGEEISIQWPGWA